MLVSGRVVRTPVKETVEVLWWLLIPQNMEPCPSLEWSVGDLVVLVLMLLVSTLRSPILLTG